MTSSKIWEAIGKLATVSTIIGTIIAIIVWVSSLVANPYNVIAKYTTYDYYIDNKTSDTILQYMDLVDQDAIHRYMKDEVQQSDIQVPMKSIEYISSMVYWYFKNNWNYAYEKSRINDRSIGLYIIDIENKSDISLKDAYLNTDMQEGNAFIKYWDGTNERVSFKNTLKLNDIKAKDKIKIFIWKDYGVTSSEINLVFDRGSVLVDKYYQLSSKKEANSNKALFAAWAIIQIGMIIFFSISRNRKTET